MKKIVKVLAAGALVASALTVVACKDGTTSTTTGGSTTTPVTTSTPTSGGSVTTSAPTTSAPTTSAPTTIAPTTTAPTPSVKYVKGNLNGATATLSVHYTGSGLHLTPGFNGASAVVGLDGKTLTPGTLLPTWQAIATNLNGTIEDGTDISKKDAKIEWKNYLETGFVGDNGKKIDLIMVDGMGADNGYTTAANTGKLQDIGALMDAGKLPNFKAWLDAQGGKQSAIWKSMRAADGKVYYLPYFDGFNNVEKMWLMNQEYIEKLLDTDSTEGLSETAAIGSNPGGFQAAVPSMNNEVLKLGDNKTVTVSYTESAVAKQNKLSVKNGKAYVQTLREHLQDVYGDYVGKDKLYAKYSEIFTSQYACYNADDLIALMRCVVNNAEYLTGTAQNLYAFVPRNGQGSRLKQMLEFTSIWGQRGVSAESGKLYFDSEGYLHDMRIEDSAYENLDRMNALYNEGFFPGSFIEGNGKVKTEWRSDCIKKGTTFALYDYNATSTVYNHDVKGDEYKSDMIPMLPPVANWNDGEASTGYYHFTEDNRSLKSGGWSIPTTGDADVACAVADYIWMPEGADIQDYGPNTTDYRAAVTQYDENGNRLAGEGTFSLNYQEVVKWSDKVINASLGETNNDKFKGNWNNFMRGYVGATQGIGHLRSDGVDYQATVSLKANAGLAKLTAAILSGGFICAKTTGVIDNPTFKEISSENLFFYSVPTGFAISKQDQTAIQSEPANTTVDNFWKDDSSVDGKVVYCRWIMGGKTATEVISTITDFDSYKALFAKVQSTYVIAYQNAYYAQD